MPLPQMMISPVARSAARLGLYPAPTVFHIEDDPLWAGAIASLISESAAFCHVGSASSGRDGVSLCWEKQPDIVLLDLGLPDIDGSIVLDKLSALPCPPQILLLTGRMNEALLYRVITGGIAGLIPKNGDFARHLRPALAAAAAGMKYFPPEVREAVSRFRNFPDAFFKILSPIERQLLSQAGSGCSDGQIARCTGRCASTIRVHFHNIMAKLGLKDRHELLRWAQAKGLLTGCDRSRCEARGRLRKSSPVYKQDV